MDLKNLSNIEKEIYWICFNSPQTTYSILAELSKKGIEVSYPLICQKCGILTAKGLMKKISVVARKPLYSSIEVKAEKKQNETEHLANLT